MKSKAIAYGAAAITLIAVSFLFFRGMTNLVNSITVPLIFLFFTQGFDQRSKLAVGSSIMLAVLFLFPAQILFTLIYLGMATLLILVNRKGILIHLLYPVLVTILLIAGVLLTDKIFQTNINEFVLHISNGKIYIYVLIFFIESLVISGLHFFFYRNILRRSMHSPRT